MGIRALLNKGLTPALKEAFPNCVPSLRPLIVDLEIKHPEWVAGFTSGEGNFMISLRKYGILVNILQLRFQLSHHICDEIIFKVSFLSRMWKGGLFA